MIRPDLCGYNDADIVVKGTVAVEGTAYAHTRNKKVTFYNNASFRSCISKNQ